MGDTGGRARIDGRDDVVWPLVGIVLAVVPFWVFGGTTSRTTVNGEVVTETAINLLGLVLAAVAVAIGVKRLLQKGGAVAVRRTLATLAVVAGVVQVPFSLGVW